MAERLSGGNTAIALLANAIATGGVLVAVILAFGPISGAHFNPAISLADAAKGGLSWPDVPAYVTAQVFGAIVGVIAANLMFAEPAISWSQHGRHGTPILLSEFIATFGLLVVIWGCARHRSHLTAFAVAAYIVGAYWFTASTSFANPAVAIARSLSNTFAGIAPQDVPGFIAMELLGTLAATALFAWLLHDRRESKDVLLPRESPEAERTLKTMKRPVLFVCVHNSARSQMAEAFLNARCPDDFVAESAGLEPGELNPLAVAAMSEVGIDISNKQTKSVLDKVKADKVYSFVITVCDETTAQKCPVFPGLARRLHWSFPDPSSLSGTWDQRLARTRHIRDEIRARIEDWCSAACS